MEWSSTLAGPPSLQAQHCTKTSKGKESAPDGKNTPVVCSKVSYHTSWPSANASQYFPTHHSTLSNIKPVNTPEHHFLKAQP